ncbi:MAG: L,D-transpeptidase [Burkholderiales bacterium]|nr:L,D-transpeptidase [Burkholderiales bacterium]
MSFIARAAWVLALSAAACAAHADSQQLLRWVTATRDHQGLPFAIVDKKQARIHVYNARGQLAGTSSVLVGATWGDHTVPGVGARAQQGAVRTDERTTPAGRFVSQPGTNLTGEHVVWVDYASAFAIHRLRPGRSHDARLKKLASETPRDNRASLGCVIVPVDFYQDVVQRVLGSGKAVVYVMPETRSLADMFAL